MTRSNKDKSLSSNKSRLICVNGTWQRKKIKDDIINENKPKRLVVRYGDTWKRIVLSTTLSLINDNNKKLIFGI